MRSSSRLLIITLVVLALAGLGASSAFAAPSTYVGYLMDVACGSGTKALDGSDPVNAPWDHTKMCLVACKASGFGVSLKVGDSYKFFKFDKKGSDAAMAQIVNKSARDKDFVVSVEGSMKDGVITVTSLKEANLL